MNCMNSSSLSREQSGFSKCKPHILNGDELNKQERRVVRDVKQTDQLFQGDVSGSGKLGRAIDAFRAESS